MNSDGRLINYTRMSVGNNISDGRIKPAQTRGHSRRAAVTALNGPAGTVFIIMYINARRDGPETLCLRCGRDGNFRTVNII